MEHMVLNAFPREAMSGGALKAARRQGNIPAQLYGKNVEPTPLFIKNSEFAEISKRMTESTILDLRVGEKRFQVIMKEIQRNVLSGEILHIDFNVLEHGRKMHAKIPLHLTGSAKGVREGGILEHAIHDIEVECDPDNLPEKIDVDITNLEANHALHLRDVPMPQGVRLLANPDTVIAIIKFARGEVAEAAAQTVAPATAEAEPEAKPEAASASIKKE